ncbi:protein sarah [Danaus plexippus]|uniref:Calcineurin-mediated signaling pathway inhibitor DSCR1 n=1 Tax=Danaus plexippus plexippus TaxID=278856 RepID=A0A212FJK8_DANPL|nr:protein sarah [Danaus plexippus]OWR53914.1 calcineurin-mediated signaling pathway inhibitor DSCR1 [Danaus plexippus plexippus]
MANKDDDETFREDDIYINPEDGMPNIHPNIADLEQESDSQEEKKDFDDLPQSIIVTNIHSDVFADEKLKKELEDLFRTFSNNVTFQWLRSFRRLRVNYDSPLSAVSARVQFHQYQFYNSCINCYFAQPVTPISLKNLKPPAPVKQFLISPPASPPVGWEPREEGEPIVNSDLLAALATLAPGESHELHAPTPTQPAIIVHTALSTTDPNASPIGKSIPHTRCPDY